MLLMSTSSMAGRQSAAMCRRRPLKALSPVARAAVSTPVASVAVAAPAVTGVESEVQNSLDNLKDRLFRLELRRQAGTITEEDYARERTRTEAILRELVRG